MRLSAFVVCSLLLAASADAAQRSKAARAEFQRENPCPATGKPRGACPGYEVDHIQPLCAGGEDRAANLQWLLVERHREKTRRDMAACSGRAYRDKGIDSP